MTAPVFAFTRFPSTKVSVATIVSGLVAADNTLIIIGRRLGVETVDAGTATNNLPVQIANYGDPVAAKTECDALFGTDSEVGKMVVAAIKGVLYSDRDPKLFPPIKAICMANAATNANLAATLAANINIPMPFVAVPFAATDATARAALKAHLIAISASDRGPNAQFGSFGYMALLDTLGNSTTAGEAIASQNIVIPWLRDAGAANAVYEVAAATAALCAANGAPFLPLNGVKIGGLVAPATVSDWHTSGDAGTAALGLDSGLVPLMIGSDGSVLISRTVTSLRTVSGTVDSAYFDLQDWQKLYYYRKNAYVLSRQPRYAVAHATDAKIKALLSELIVLAKSFEELEMFQHVDQLVKSFEAFRQVGNRSAAVYRCPVNVVPGFHNQGIALEGTTQFDVTVL